MATGKRAGARRAAPARSTPSVDARILTLAAGITACVVAWGYLVYAAIDFGAAGRSGSASGWGMLALASLGAMACLFAGLMLASRLTTALGLSKEPAEEQARDATPPASTSPGTSADAETAAPATPTPPPSPAATPAARRQPGGRRIARR